VPARAIHVTFRLRPDGLHIEGDVETIVIALRTAEQRILTLLALARGKAVSREMLGRAALGRTDAGADQSVKQHVSTLRGKLSEYEYDYLLSTTRDGKGYALTQPVLVESIVATR
jgi:DNA-binding response OmpR family regulator